MAYIK
jgi:DnaJ family protein C protein 7